MHEDYFSAQLLLLLLLCCCCLLCLYQLRKETYCLIYEGTELRVCISLLKSTRAWTYAQQIAMFMYLICKFEFFFLFIFVFVVENVKIESFQGWESRFKDGKFFKVILPNKLFCYKILFYN